VHQLKKQNLSQKPQIDALQQEVEEANKRVDQVKQHYEVEFKKEFEEQQRKYENELQEWSYKCKK
jgi:uncharacterized protein YlxW (UPF0749 family)